jgi:hypothetical protein
MRCRLQTMGTGWVSSTTARERQVSLTPQHRLSPAPAQVVRLPLAAAAQLHRRTHQLIIWLTIKTVACISGGGGGR